MVNCYSSYNSCADLGAMFQVMFPDSKIVSIYTGKNKSKIYNALWNCPEFKKQLIYDINASPFYTASFDESLNSQVQMSQMDVRCGIGIIERTLLKLATLTQNSRDDLMLTFYSKTWMNRSHHWQGAVSPVSYGWTSSKLERFEIAWWQTGIWKPEQNSEHWKLCTACCSWGFENWNKVFRIRHWQNGCSIVRLLGAMSNWRKAFLESFLSGNNSTYTSESSDNHFQQPGWCENLHVT